MASVIIGAIIEGISAAVETAVTTAVSTGAAELITGVADGVIGAATTGGIEGAGEAFVGGLMESEIGALGADGLLSEFSADAVLTSSEYVGDVIAGDANAVLDAALGSDEIESIDAVAQANIDALQQNLQWADTAMHATTSEFMEQVILANGGGDYYLVSWFTDNIGHLYNKLYSITSQAASYLNPYYYYLNGDSDLTSPEIPDFVKAAVDDHFRIEEIHHTPLKLLDVNGKYTFHIQYKMTSTFNNISNNERFKSFLFNYSDDLEHVNEQYTLEALKENVRLNNLLDSSADLTTDLFEDVKIFKDSDTIQIQNHEVYKYLDIDTTSNRYYVVKSEPIVFPHGEYCNVTRLLFTPAVEDVPTKKGYDVEFECVAITLQFDECASAAQQDYYVLGISNKFIPLVSVRSKLDYLKMLKEKNDYVLDDSVLEMAFAKNGQREHIPFDVDNLSGFIPHYPANNYFIYGNYHQKSDLVENHRNVTVNKPVTSTPNLISTRDTFTGRGPIFIGGVMNLLTACKFKTELVDGFALPKKAILQLQLRPVYVKKGPEIDIEQILKKKMLEQYMSVERKHQDIWGGIEFRDNNFKRTIKVIDSTVNTFTDEELRFQVPTSTTMEHAPTGPSTQVPTIDTTGTEPDPTGITSESHMQHFGESYGTKSPFSDWTVTYGEFALSLIMDLCLIRYFVGQAADGNTDLAAGYTQSDLDSWLSLNDNWFNLTHVSSVNEVIAAAGAASTI
ncbi:hypothetical protein ACF0H5_000659 [Mactra antiquata]